jgi:hypothetical protein
MFQEHNQELAFISKTQCYCKNYLHCSITQATVKSAKKLCTMTDTTEKYAILSTARGYERAPVHRKQ